MIFPIFPRFPNHIIFLCKLGIFDLVKSQLSDDLYPPLPGIVKEIISFFLNRFSNVLKMILH